VKPGDDGRDESRPYNMSGVTNPVVNAGFFINSGVQESEVRIQTTSLKYSALEKDRCVIEIL
jgi:hypothetical protein